MNAVLNSTNSIPRSPRDVAVEIIRRLQAVGHVAVLAGGCVRDELLGKEPKDFDVATSATPDEIEQLFERSIPTGKHFGVITVVIDGVSTEIATFRGDSKDSDGRRPDSVRFFTEAGIESMRRDAERRDLTINAMFKDPISNEIFDFFGGREDINSRVLRAVGNPEERIIEDRLRMLRAIRFAAVLQFSLDESMLTAIKRNARLISGS